MSLLDSTLKSFHETINLTTRGEEIFISKKSFSRELLKAIKSDDFNDFIHYVQNDFDEFRQVKNPVRNDAQYIKFTRAVSLIEDLLSIKTIEGSAYVDDPEFPGRFHTISLYIRGDFESKEQIKIFSELLECFVSFTITGYDDFRVDFTFMIENIYTEG